VLKLSQYPIPHAATVWSLASSVALGLGGLWYGSGPDRTRRFCGGEQVDALHAQLTERGITAPSPRDAFWGDQRTL